MAPPEDFLCWQTEFGKKWSYSLFATSQRVDPLTFLPHFVSFFFARVQQRNFFVSFCLILLFDLASSHFSSSQSKPTTEVLLHHAVHPLFVADGLPVADGDYVVVSEVGGDAVGGIARLCGLVLERCRFAGHHSEEVVGD